MTQINAYLTFDGNCEEVMTFYKECLGGELTINRVADSPVAAQCAEEMKDKVLHANLINEGLILMASDKIMPGELVRGNACSLSLNCSSVEEITTFYEKLSAGGKIIQPLQDQFWGALFGMFDDRFGVCWLLNFDKN